MSAWGGPAVTHAVLVSVSVAREQKGLGLRGDDGAGAAEVIWQTAPCLGLLLKLGDTPA